MEISSDPLHVHVGGGEEIDIREGLFEVLQWAGTAVFNKLVAVHLDSVLNVRHDAQVRSVCNNLMETAHAWISGLSSVLHASPG